MIPSLDFALKKNFQINIMRVPYVTIYQSKHGILFLSNNHFGYKNILVVLLIYYK